ncbi:MAG: hypothetical protein HY324_02055 [Chlamydiia bacterium]|nr:hypothetical protein [Chlamydiia bacterium]
MDFVVVKKGEEKPLKEDNSLQPPKNVEKAGLDFYNDVKKIFIDNGWEENSIDPVIAYCNQDGAHPFIGGTILLSLLKKQNWLIGTPASDTDTPSKQQSTNKRSKLTLTIMHKQKNVKKASAIIRLKAFYDIYNPNDYDDNFRRSVCITTQIGFNKNGKVLEDTLSATYEIPGNEMDNRSPSPKSVTQTPREEPLSLKEKSDKKTQKISRNQFLAIHFSR